jgi:cytochrome c-type biogenesis protein CcmH/NrfF
MNMLRTHIWLGVFAVSALAYAGAVEEPRARVHRLEKAVLAPCCYTETVGQHQSEIAVQMRVEIAKWVEQGKTDREILDTYASRYGAKVLVDPNTIPKGWTLAVPWVIAGLGMLGGTWLLWRWRATRLATPTSPDGAGVVLPDVPDLEDD